MILILTYTSKRLFLCVAKLPGVAAKPNNPTKTCNFTINIAQFMPKMVRNRKRNTCRCSTCTRMRARTVAYIMACMAGMQVALTYGKHMHPKTKFAKQMHFFTCELFRRTHTTMHQNVHDEMHACMHVRYAPCTDAIKVAPQRGHSELHACCAYPLMSVGICRKQPM